MTETQLRPASAQRGPLLVYEGMRDWWGEAGIQRLLRWMPSDSQGENWLNWGGGAEESFHGSLLLSKPEPEKVTFLAPALSATQDHTSVLNTASQCWPTECLKPLEPKGSTAAMPLFKFDILVQIFYSQISKDSNGRIIFMLISIQPLFIVCHSISLIFKRD